MSFEPDSERHVIVSVVDEPANGNGNGKASRAANKNVDLEPPRPQEMVPHDLRRGEGDLIDDLFRSDEKTKAEVHTLVLPRIQIRQQDAEGNLKRDEQGNLVYGPLELRFRALRQSDIDRERRRCGRVWEINEEGQRENVFDPTELNARVMALSLVPEDRQKYLEDKRMWDHFGAGGPVDLIDKWLTAGELAKAGAMVMQMSGIPMNAGMQRLLMEPSSEVGAG